MSITETISNMFSAIKAHPKFMIPELILVVLGTVVGIVAAIAIILGAGGLHSSALGSSSTLKLVVSLLPIIIIAAIIFFLIVIFFLGWQILLCSKWEDKKVSLSVTMGMVSKRYPSLLAYEVIVLLVGIVVLLIFGLPLLSALYNSVWIPHTQGVKIAQGTILGLIGEFAILGILGLIAYVIIAVLFLFGPPIVMLENSSAIEAIKKSISIGKKNFLGILAFLIVNVIVIGVMEIITALIGIIPILGQIISILFGIFISTYATMIPTMYYITDYKK